MWLLNEKGDVFISPNFSTTIDLIIFSGNWGYSQILGKQVQLGNKMGWIKPLYAIVYAASISLSSAIFLHATAILPTVPKHFILMPNPIHWSLLLFTRFPQTQRVIPFHIFWIEFWELSFERNLALTMLTIPFCTSQNRMRSIPNLKSASSILQMQSMHSQNHILR